MIIGTPGFNTCEEIRHPNRRDHTEGSKEMSESGLSAAQLQAGWRAGRGCGADQGSYQGRAGIYSKCGCVKQ